MGCSGRSVRRIFGWGAVLVALALTPEQARAQSPVRVMLGGGFGGSMPISAASDFFEFGWFAQANVALARATWPARLRFDVVYHSLEGEEIPAFDNRLQIIGALLNLELRIPRTGARDGGLFVVGGPSFYYLDVDQTIQPVGESGLRIDSGGEGQFGLIGGLAYKFAVPRILISIEGKYHAIFTDGGPTQLIPFGIVVEVPLNGR